MYRFALFVFTILLLLLSFIYLEVAVLPFIFSLVLSYILWPVHSCISKFIKVNDSVLVGLIVLAFLILCISFLTYFVPLAYHQLYLLIAKLDSYRAYVQELIPVLVAKLNHINPQYAEKVNHFIDNSANDISKAIFGSVEQVLGYTIATIHFFVMLFIVPVITFYILRDWSISNLNLKKYFGSDIAKEVNNITKQINEVLSGYIRGQLNVSTIIAIYYSFFLWLINFEFALLMGIVTGIAIMVPFAGFLVSFTIALIIGYFHFGFSISLLYLVIIYCCGSILEGSILTPRIIGQKIGLHPLWVIFAILSFAKLFGVIGMLLAIPLAGITKVVLVSILNRLAKKYGNE